MKSGISMCVLHSDELKAALKERGLYPDVTKAGYEAIEERDSINPDPYLSATALMNDFYLVLAPHTKDYHTKTKTDDGEAFYLVCPICSIYNCDLIEALAESERRMRITTQ